MMITPKGKSILEDEGLSDDIFGISKLEQEVKEKLN